MLLLCCSIVLLQILTRTLHVYTPLQDSGASEAEIAALKKRKLVLRDRISFIEDQLTPDIIA